MNRSFICVLLVIFILSVFTGTTVSHSTVGNLFFAINQEKLRSGGMQLLEFEEEAAGSGRRKRLLGVMLVNAPPEKVWSVLKQWERTPDFVPDIQYYRTLKVLKPVKSGHTGESIIEGSMRAALMNIIYTLHVKFYEDRMQHEWRLVSNDEIKIYASEGLHVKRNHFSLKAVEGFGFVESFGDGSRSIYYYSPVVEVRVPVPSSVERSLIKGAVHDYMNGLKKLVEE